MNDLARLLYVSTAARTIEHYDLYQILESSRKNNAQAGITGVLCSSGHHFVQLLEGPENSLIRLYGRILDDERHRDCVLIGITPIVTPMFDKWSMGYINRSEDDILMEREELLHYRLQSGENVLVDVMKQFLDRLKSSAPQ